MILVTRILRRVVVSVCVVLGSVAVASAQDSFDPGANQIVNAIAVQPDGKILVGGQFTGLGGGTGTTVRNRIGRLNADGTVDPTFNPGANSIVQAIAVQRDGSIIIGGNFTSVGGGTGLTTPRNHLARFYADGTVDPTFNPGANLIVYSIVVQPDGKILVGGDFSLIGGGGTGNTSRLCLARLNSDGSVDAFNPGASKTFGAPIVYTMALQPDGMVVVGGYFNGLGGGTGSNGRNFIGRIDGNGNVDAFNPGVTSISGVNALAIQADGRIVVGGTFTGLGGALRANIGRLESDGQIDITFNPGAETQVLTLGIQTDGKIVAGGYFKWLGDAGGPNKSVRNYIGRLHSNGVVDSAFNPGAGNVVNGLALQGDGSLLAVGVFGTVGGGLGAQTVRTRLARFSPTDAAVQTLTVTGGGTQPTTMTWLRSGSGPEVTRTTMEFSFDGSFYSSIADGHRIAGGWQGTGVNLPNTSRVVYYRAVGYYGSGFQNGSGSLVATFSSNIVAMSASPGLLRFSATKQGATGPLLAVTPAQTVTVTFAGGVGEWTATADQPWVQITNGSGIGAGQFSVGIINPGNVIGGATGMGASIAVTSPTSLSTSVIILQLTIDQTGNSTGPAFGQVDTPVQNATGVQGAIGVTGWALDDVGVTGVKIYRNCVPFEPQGNCQTVLGESLVYIGDAAFVAGARPDVEAAFSTYPLANRAGFGYLLLTNMLPHVPSQLGFGGQGALSLHAIATDAEGHLTRLGRSTTSIGADTTTQITMANDTIAKPFGAIDTPGQGQTVSGALPNFGWVLTPDSNNVADAGDILMATSGPAMLVYIDGAPVGAVTYNQCRGTVGNPVPNDVYCNDDVANIFGNPTPQPTFTLRSSNPTRYRNLDAARAAIGSFDINTLALSNGTHSLAWGATDTAGRVEGIGSRNFVVLNSGGSSIVTVGGDAVAAPATHGASSSLAAHSTSVDTVWGRTGFDLATSSVPAPADTDGVRHISIPELGRLELTLGTGVEAGYLDANGTLRDLPGGSNLDVSTGTFTWAPLPGYIGTYRLTFVRGVEKTLVDVVIRPAGTIDPTQGEVRMFIDQAGASQTGTGPITIAGWALDPQMSINTGIDAVHVWVTSPGTPVFVGAAKLGGKRPDVAAAYGAQFQDPGFSLTTSALAPGEYDLTIYVHSARTGRWEDARSVHVVVR